ncbi:DUF1176 domain-containing protein [Pseudomonas sp. MAP12]|uniref:DUF1176 domain-containing protein n=1 Tax=Geopseudomonas aromaticivorans TaxID=2849492 RepID=A0ABS6MTD3_9GAMM|nr:DUF1176 domain-containing protein [Pseudomonas aromaticivorans]MBV2132078.1 DUF1176 domain-containing protein [Pseudomonas aromaticivorans]
MTRPTLPLILALLPATLWAQETTPAGVGFTHHNWQLACDNTRTCRAAGYQSDDDQLPVSVLLTRKAGPQQPVTGQVKLGYFVDYSALEQLPAEFRLAMSINRCGLDVTRWNSLGSRRTTSSESMFPRKHHGSC